MWFPELRRRLSVLFRRERFDRDLDEEMQFHLDLQAEQNQEQGVDAEEAYHRARRQFGNATVLKEVSREMWGWGSVERLGQDLEYAFRVLRKNPGFTAVVVLVLALGIGANTAIFTVVNALLLNPFPAPEPDRLVLIESRHASKSSGAHYRDFLDWRERNAVFDEMAILSAGTTPILTGQGQPGRIKGGLATSSFFRVMGVQPVLGRVFTAKEDSPGAPAVAVLSFVSWRHRFGGRPDVLGEVMVLNGTPHTIVGVMPSRFVSPWWSGVEYWAPLQGNPAAARSGQQYRTVFARLKPGITLTQARANMTAIASGLEQQYPETNKGWGVAVAPAASPIRGASGRAVGLLFSIVLFVLLLASANVAGLMLARASGRAKEMAVRASLGASRLRIVRQMLTESVLLGVLGGTFGLMFARWLLDALRAAAPSGLGLDATLRIDSTVLVFTLAMSGFTGVVFGVAPALYGSNVDLNTALKGGANASSGARSRSRFLSGLVVGEVALSLVLLVGGGLLARDFLWLLHVDTGVRTDRLLTFLLRLPRAKYSTQMETTSFYQELLERLRAAPGVEAAGAIDTLPMGGNKSGGRFQIDGSPQPADSSAMRAILHRSTPGYLRTIGIPLLRGREFDDRDTVSAQPVAIIDETLARRFFTNQDPIGQRIELESGGPSTVVGVVGSAKHDGPWYDAEPQIYFPLEQSPSSEMFIAVRSAADPMKLAGVVGDTVRALDRDLPVERLRSMEQVFADSLSVPRLLTWFLAAFAAFGLALAAIGIYGVVAYSVKQSTHEMGVRIALGASSGDVLALVLRKGARLAMVGVAVGVPAALAVSRVMESLLVGVSPRDVIVFAGVPVVLMTVALVASYIPARRAATVDPIEALRVE